MSPLRESVKVKGPGVVGQKVGYRVEPNPKRNSYDESQGYDYVLKVDYDLFDRVCDFEGHKRAVRVPR